MSCTVRLQMAGFSSEPSWTYEQSFANQSDEFLLDWAASTVRRSRAAQAALEVYVWAKSDAPDTAQGDWRLLARLAFEEPRVKVRRE